MGSRKERGRQEERREKISVLQLHLIVRPFLVLS